MQATGDELRGFFETVLPHLNEVWTSHPDRDGQFRYLNTQAAERVAAGEPVISVDTKKNGSATWVACGSMVSNTLRYGPDRSNVAHWTRSRHC